MIYYKENLLARVNTLKLTQFILLSSLSIVIPFFFHIQWITGPIINAILILTIMLLGIREGVIVALVPSLIALSRGLLPAILAPAVPFIMFSNILFIIAIDYVYNGIKKDNVGYWLGVFFGSLLKFLFLYFSVNLVTEILIKKDLGIKIAQMMSWPQFITAMIGGVIAWIVLKWLKRL